MALLRSAPLARRRHDRSHRPLPGARLSRPLLRPVRRGRSRRAKSTSGRRRRSRSRSAKAYANPYVDVECWIELAGPGFAKRVYGFWDGGRTFKVRFVATAPGEWRWTSGSNQPDDAGLNGGRGRLRAVAWSDDEKTGEPNRRGFVRATPNGHALQHADGTPFFLVGDTWLAASTWRLPLRGGPPAADYVPASGISFEEAVAYAEAAGLQLHQLHLRVPELGRRPPRRHLRERGRRLPAQRLGEVRPLGAERPDHAPPTARLTTAKDMHDEHGNRPFEMLADRDGLADFDRIEPRLLPQPRPQDAAPGRRGLRAVPRDRPSRLHARPGRPTSTSTRPTPATSST